MRAQVEQVLTASGYQNRVWHQSSDPVRPIRLNAIAAKTSQAPLAENVQGEVCEGAALEVGDDLLDDGVAAVGRLGLEHDQWGVGEDAVVAVGREQLSLAVGDGRGVEAFDPADDQPGADVVGFAAGRERGEGDFGDFGVGDEPLLVVVPDRVRIPDRGPCRLRDARDRCDDSGEAPQV